MNGPLLLAFVILAICIMTMPTVLHANWCFLTWIRVDHELVSVLHAALPQVIVVLVSVGRGWVIPINNGYYKNYSLNSLTRSYFNLEAV